jgi:hypothetical protein
LLEQILQSTLFAPLIALVLWSFVMWARLYATRIPAITMGKIVLDPQRPKEVLLAQIPAWVRWKADNYNNLMEQPTLFYAVYYAVTLTLALLSAGDILNTSLAWLYVGLRVAHSLGISSANAGSVSATARESSSVPIISLKSDIALARANFLSHRRFGGDDEA